MIDWPLLIISVLFGVFTKLFFEMIKFQTENERLGPVSIGRPPTEHDFSPQYAMAYEPINYLSVSEFIALGSRMPILKKWVKYISFRLTPPAIMTILLASVMAKYFPETPQLPYLLISTGIMLLLMDVGAFVRTHIVAYRLLYVWNVFITLLATLAIYMVAQATNLSFIAPNVSDLFTNIWATLLVAVLVVFYLQAVNFNPVDKKQVELQREDNAFTNYVLQSYNQINLKFGEAINQLCKQHGTAKSLLYAILIYENLNRPRLVRVLENAMVRMLGVPLTVGIAQVRSERPLSDIESIEIAAGKLKGTQSNFWNVYNYPFVDLQKLLKPYNSGAHYPESIYKIMQILSRYAPQLYEQESPS